MTHKKKLSQVTIIILLSMVALSIIVTSYSQSQKDAKQDTNKNLIPVVDFDKVNTDNEAMQQIRQKRGSRYEHSKSTLFIRAEPEGVEPLPVITHWDSNLPAIPVTKSDLVATGYVDSIKAHLTDDRKGLYTEVSIGIKEILKGAENFALKPNQFVFADREGGGVRFSSGRTQYYRIKGQRIPHTNGEYLFFLSYDKDGDAFSILTAYEFLNDRVQALDAPEKFAAYTGALSQEFLETVRDLVKGGRDQ